MVVETADLQRLALPEQDGLLWILGEFEDLVQLGRLEQGIKPLETPASAIRPLSRWTVFVVDTSLASICELIAWTMLRSIIRLTLGWLSTIFACLGTSSAISAASVNRDRLIFTRRFSDRSPR